MTGVSRDPTLYPSAALAAAAPPEKRAFVVVSGDSRVPDALHVIDVDRGSPGFGGRIQQLALPGGSNGVRHISWNAGSSSLCPYCPPHDAVRRYLILTALETGRLFVIDVADADRPRLAKTLEQREVAARTGFRRPGAIRSGPEGVLVANLEGEGSGGIGYFLVDQETLEIVGPRACDHPELVIDFAHHIGYDAIVEVTTTARSGRRDGGRPSGGRWSLDVRNVQTWDTVARLKLPADRAVITAPRAAHQPTSAWGLVATTSAAREGAAEIWKWQGGAFDGGIPWRLDRFIGIPHGTSARNGLFGRILRRLRRQRSIGDIVLTTDDRELLVCSSGSSEILRYDISDHSNPRLTSSLVVAEPTEPPPANIVASLDGRRLYVTSGRGGEAAGDPWMRLVELLDDGSMKLDKQFRVVFPGGEPQRTRLSTGDSSSEVYCFR